MSLFIALKVIHVLSAITAVGANVTYAFWLRRGGTDRDAAALSRSTASGGSIGRSRTRRTSSCS